MKIDYRVCNRLSRIALLAAVFGIIFFAARHADAVESDDMLTLDSNEVSVSSRASSSADNSAVQLASMAEFDDSSAPGEDFESDPLESFNEKMFWFNREVLDRYLLKPIATAWDFVLPDPFQRGIHNVFDNLAVVRRVVNNTLQLKLTGAATELARFTINSTVGLVGFFDVARDAFGIQQRDEDAGQTFGVWGIGPGPYLVLPFLPPLTATDHTRWYRICHRLSHDAVYLFYSLVRQSRRHCHQCN
jgi:ABC-type transporter lipoprotein component MlaA